MSVGTEYGIVEEEEEDDSSSSSSCSSENEEENSSYSSHASENEEEDSSSSFCCTENNEDTSSSSPYSSENEEEDSCSSLSCSRENGEEDENENDEDTSSSSPYEENEEEDSSSSLSFSGENGEKNENEDENGLLIRHRGTEGPDASSTVRSGGVQRQQSAATGSHEQKTGLSKELQCPICLEMFNRATTLGCGHTFCAGCVEDVRARGGNNKCPMCRTRITSSIRSVTLDNIIRNIAA